MLLGQFHGALLEMLREMFWRCGDAAQACSHRLSTTSAVRSRQKTLALHWWLVFLQLQQSDEIDDYRSMLFDSLSPPRLPTRRFPLLA